MINSEKTRKMLHKRWLTDPVKNPAEIHMVVPALYWATLVPTYFSFDTSLEIRNLENDSSKLMAGGYVGSCIMSGREIHSVFRNKN